ncbi:MAG: class IV adenylate cyclase [Gemmataceae bacterium]
MLEVEMKFPVKDFKALEARLAEWQAQPDQKREDEDTYFKPPDRDYAATDEALRIRRIGQANFVTYKGPKVDAHTKTRTEIEVPLAPGNKIAGDFATLLLHLRYRPVATVKKHRRIFHLERQGFPLEVSLDEVEGVGIFAELEIQAEQDRLDEARKVLMQTAHELGLVHSERRSYLEMFLTRQADKQ